MNSYIPWMQINEFLLDVGTVRTPKEFCIQAVKSIFSLIPYDQARLYFINENGNVYDEVLFGVEKRWSDLYLEYYSKIENGRYSIHKRIESSIRTIPTFVGGMYDWTKFECDEFISGYIIPQGINYTIGSAFCSVSKLAKTVYCFDRTSRCGFTPGELEIIEIVHPHLDNLYQNLFVYPKFNQPFHTQRKTESRLTLRETEIAELLCFGITPNKIGSNLHISVQTVYRHIANIHRKLNVSNRQELLLKLMDSQAKN